MRTNLPVTQREFEYPEHQMLVSSRPRKTLATLMNACF